MTTRGETRRLLADEFQAHYRWADGVLDAYIVHAEAQVLLLRPDIGLTDAGTYSTTIPAAWVHTVACLTAALALLEDSSDTSNAEKAMALTAQAYRELGLSNG